MIRQGVLLTIDLRSIQHAFKERALQGLDPEDGPLSTYERCNRTADVHAGVKRCAPDASWWKDHGLWDEWHSEETVNRMATEGTVLAHMAAQTNGHKRDFWREMFADVWREVKAELRQEREYIPLPFMRDKRGERPLHEWGNRRGQEGWVSIRDPEFHDDQRSYYDIKRAYQAKVSSIDLSRYLTRA